MRVNKILFSTIVLMSFVVVNCQNEAMSMLRQPEIPREELTPDEKLILAVEGYKKTGAAVLIGMVNPIMGLMVACAPNEEQDKDLDKIRKILASGANVNCRDKLTWTPLLYAAYGGYPRIAQLLLENGADKTLAPTKRGIRDWTGYTPIRIAEYYLEKYTRMKASCKPDMVEHYDNLIQRYAQLIELLS